MRNMKFSSAIKCFALLIALLLLCLLASCHGPKNPDTPTVYRVTFLYQDGSDAVSLEIAEGGSYTLPEAPSRPGYDFEGWFCDPGGTVPANAGTPTEDLTIYAVWTPHTSVRLTFDTLGGTRVSPVVVEKGNTASAPETAPEKTGYDFSGWTAEAGSALPYNFSVAPSESMTLYAIWTLKDSYAELICVSSGETVTTIAVEKNTTVDLSTETALSGYLWYTGEDLNTAYDFNEKITGSLTIYGEAYTEGLLVENGVVTGYTGDATRVVVPSVFQGTPVTEIGENAFKGKNTIHSVTLPATVKKIGANAFADCSWIESVNLTDTCTELGAYAFYSCDRLSDVGDLSALLSIPEGAFLGCSRIASLQLGDAVTDIGAYAFADCVTLTAVSMPDTVTDIGAYAFSGCSLLESFHVSAALKNAGTGFLTKCTGLKSITGGNSYFRVTDNVLYGNRGKTLLLYAAGDESVTEFTIPSGVTLVAENAFYGNADLVTLTVSSSLTKLARGALAGMQSLKSLTVHSLDSDNSYLAYYFGAEDKLANGSSGDFVPATLTELTFTDPITAIPDYAFYGCVYLSTINGISELSSVGAYAFAYTAIQTVTIGDALETIGENAFVGCESLLSFTVSKNNTSFAAYDDCLYNKALTELLLVPQSKTEVKFPSSIQKIASGAFYMSAVTEVAVPQSVTEIGKGAFISCNAMTKLTVPFIGASATTTTENNMIHIFGGAVIRNIKTTTDDDGNPEETTTYSVTNSGAAPLSLKTLIISGTELTEIPDFGFAFLPNVTEIQFSGSVTKIGLYGYYNCGLETVTVPDTVTVIGAYAFSSMPNLTEMTVPGSVKQIGNFAFAFNSELEAIVFEEGVTDIPYAACFPSYSSSSTNPYYGSALTSITIPSTVVSIGDFAFAYAGTVYFASDNVTFGELELELAKNSQLKTIGSRAFYYSSVERLDFSDKLENVGELAFAFCKKLSSLTFGDSLNGSSLKTIGGAALSYCAALKTLTIYVKVASAETVPVLAIFEDTANHISVKPFEGGAVPNIYVVGAAYYRSAENWNDYENKISEIGR